MKKSNPKFANSTAPQRGPALNHEQIRIRKWVAQTKFKRAVFGGVSESDVWKKIGELTELYEAAISAERARYDALLRELTGTRPDWEER